MMIIQPNSAAKRMSCPGSAALESLCPKKEKSTVQQDGELLHKIAATMLRKRRIDHTLKNCGSAKFYVTYVLQELKKSSADELYIERPLCIRDWVFSEYYVIPDAFFYSREKGELHIFEFKTGHTAIKAYRNWQMIYYALGIFQFFRMGVQQQSVVFHVIQPKVFTHEKISIFKTDTVQTFKWINELAEREKQCFLPDALCVPNPLCKICDARHMCAALNYKTTEVIQRWTHE